MLTPIAMAGNMYFMRFLTSGSPRCLIVSPLLIWRSMSPPSSLVSIPDATGAAAILYDGGGKRALSSCVARRGDVSVGSGGMFWAIGLWRCRAPSENHNVARRATSL